ncbi:Hypothetical predicted protein, partial [Olea europaea subsp. europaea]
VSIDPGDSEDSYCALGTECLDNDTIYIYTKYCAESGCHWDVRKDGLYKLINGHYVLDHVWVPDG